MKFVNFFSFSFLLFHRVNYSQVSASNILIFHTMATASHRTSIWPLVEKLGDAGHNITYAFPISRRIGSHPQVTELKPSKLFAAVDEWVGDFDINIRLNNTQDKWMMDAFLKGISFCEAFYDSPEIQQWLATPGLHYDLVMMDGALGSCAYGLVYKFKAKQIIFTPATIPFYWDPFGIVPESSSVPECMFHRKPADLLNSLWSRVINTLAQFVWRLVYLGSMRSMEQVVREKLNMTDMPSFEEIEQETSLVLHNTHFVEDYPMSLPPMYVSYSGLLCTEKDRKERKPLPQELETFVGDNNSDGFVYVSFGSSVLLSAMPQSMQTEFFGALAQFPRLKFLIKWTGHAPNNAPNNVLFQSWFPQKDVLADPRIKAFIFQAGRPSTQEALCFGVPMITLPIFSDQDLNSDRLEHIGAAVSVDIMSLTSETLSNAIREIVETNKYKTRLSELSAMFIDRPVDPIQNAHYWVEYVLKYDTTLLKPLAMKQTWWQRRLLDVYALILGIFSGLFYWRHFFYCIIFQIYKKTRHNKNGEGSQALYKERLNISVHCQVFCKFICHNPVLAGFLIKFI